MAKHKIIDTILERDEWNDTPAGNKLKLLRGIVSRRQTAMEKLGALITHSVQAQDKDTNLPFDHEELMHAFGDFISTEFDGVKVNGKNNDGQDGSDITDGDIIIDVPPTLDPVVKSFFQICRRQNRNCCHYQQREK